MKKNIALVKYQTQNTVYFILNFQSAINSLKYFSISLEDYSGWLQKRLTHYLVFFIRSDDKTKTFRPYEIRYNLTQFLKFDVGVETLIMEKSYELVILKNDLACFETIEVPEDLFDLIRFNFEQ